MKTLNLPLVKASLARAESELGTNAPFDDVLARARQLTPDAFGHLFDDGRSQSSTKRIHAAAASEAGTEGERFYRDLAAATFGELNSEDEAKAFIEEYGVDGKKTAAQRFEDREKAEAKEAEEAEEAGKELERRAKQLVASGSAASIEDGLIQAAQADSALYLTSCAAPAIRPDTKEKLKQLREKADPGAYAKLCEIAAGLLESKKAKNGDEAYLMACEANPELYQEVEDAKEAALKKSTQAPKKSATVGASDFEEKARNLVTAGQARDIDEAFGMVAASDSSAYANYLASLKG